MKALQSTLRKLQVESNKRDAKLYANMFERMSKDADVALKVLDCTKVFNDHAQIPKSVKTYRQL